MILKFGKYKGYNLSEVPQDYLFWLHDSTKQNIQAIEAELAYRSSSEDARMSWAERVISAGYRQLAIKHHPDAGGDSETMKEINLAVEKLRRMAGQK